MFISKMEKLKLISGIMDLMATVQKLDSEIIYLKGRIKALEGGNKERKKRTISEETRAKMSQMMKARHAKNKMEKEYADSLNAKSK
jgi:hypothetical protein